MPVIPVYRSEKPLDTAPNTLPRDRFHSATVTPSTAAERGAGELATAQQNLGKQVAGIGERILGHASDGDQKLEDFQTEQRWQQTTNKLDQALTERQRNAPPGAKDLAVTFTNADLDPTLNDFHKSVPPRLAERYQARSETFRDAALFKAADTEYKTRNDYFKTTIEQNAGGHAAMVSNNPDSLVQARDNLYGQIDSTTLTSTEKEALKSRHGLTLVNASIDGLIKAKRYDDARALAASVAGSTKDGPPPIDNMGTPGAARSVIAKAAQDQGFDPQVAVMVAHLESGLDPNAANSKSTARGLFQLRQKERKQMGVGDNASIEEQAQKGVAWLKDKASELAGQGIQVTPFTLYMAHFQGTGGAKAILSAPANASLVDVLDSVRPGFQDKQGRSYGEVVTSANNLDANMTVGDFRTKFERKVTGGMMAAGMGGLDWKERHALVSKTDTLIQSDENDQKRTDRETIARTKVLVEDDIASLASTGQEVADARLNAHRVTELLGENKATEWMLRRENARRLYAVTKDFESVPQDEIQKRLDQLAPKAGTEGFTDAENAYEFAQKKAARIIKLREDDPARAVENDGGVRAAREGYDPQRPETIQALVEARFAAQSRAGIPQSAQAPITNQEARQLATQIEGGLPSQTRARMEGMLTGLQTTYGKHADEVLVYVIGAAVKNRDLAELAAGMWKKLSTGQRPTTAEAKATDTLSSINDAARATSGNPTVTQGIGEGGAVDYSQPFGPEQRVPKPAPPVPPFTPTKPFNRERIVDLIKNPETAKADFDAEFGAGAADTIFAWQKHIFQSQDKRAEATNARP